MRARAGWWAAIIVTLGAPLSAQASGVTVGAFSAVFDGIAALGLAVSALLILLGYRLMMKSMDSPRVSPRSNVKVGMKSFNVSVGNAAPGVVFAVLGCVGLIASLWHFAK